MRLSELITGLLILENYPIKFTFLPTESKNFGSTDVLVKITTMNNIYVMNMIITIAFSTQNNT